MRRSFFRLGLGILLAMVFAWTAGAQDLGTIRVGVLKFGTVNWELDVIKRHGLDKQAGFNLDVHGFGANDAADVALMGDGVDAIVEDWLFVSRQRADGAKLAFIPYSSSVGALIVGKGSSIERLTDLAGKKLGVAGGALDKGWLILQALGRKEGIDLAKEAEPVFAAPPLLNEKLKSGELSAVLNYWHFAARLEADGYKRLLGVGDAQRALGVPADTIQLGYVFKEDWANRNPKLVQAFAEASRAAKKIMAESDAEWQRIRELTRAENDAVLKALMARYREGIPQRWNEADRQAAAKLYEVLAEIGGEKLVGKAKTLAPGTFWAGVSY